jgi:hypothetical protein
MKRESVRTVEEMPFFVSIHPRGVAGKAVRSIDVPKATP